MKIEDLISSEIDSLKKTLESQITDPAERLAIIQMTNDLALLPIRMSSGQDVSLVLASIKAEAALRGSAFALRTQAAVQQAWLNIVTKLVTAAIAGILV